MCAIVGGVLGQEVIKVSSIIVVDFEMIIIIKQALSGQDEPYLNSFLYDSVNSTGIVETLRT